MAGSYNRLTIIGHLGHDPEMRYLPDGTPLTTFDVAVNERRQVDGQTVQTTQWFHVTCYGKLAETAAEHLRGAAPSWWKVPSASASMWGKPDRSAWPWMSGRVSCGCSMRCRGKVKQLRKHSVEPTPAQDRNAVAATRAGALPDDFDQVPF
jgi:hypothetical protein